MQNKPPDNNKRSTQNTELFFREVQIEFLIHELKDPISVIETGTRTLLEKRENFGPLSPRQEKTLNRVLRSTKRARQMLNSLLEIGRSEAGCFLCCSFQPAKATFEVLMEALEIKAAALSEQIKNFTQQTEILRFLSDRGISLEIAPQLETAEMFQDETKFRQIVGNLIKNALHYRKDRLAIKMNCEKDCVIIDVADDGPGIDPEHHQAIFQRYTQINQLATPSRQGHGLGLAGALIMARFLGGDIELRSVKGEGASFRLILPITLNRDAGNYE